MAKIFFFSIPHNLVSGLSHSLKELPGQYELSGALSVTRASSPIDTSADILDISDVYQYNPASYPSDLPPPSDFFDFISPREITLCRTISRFVNVRSYSIQQKLLFSYATYWFNYIARSQHDLFLFPSTPHRGVDNVAFEVLLFLGKRPLLLTELHEPGCLLLSEAVIGRPHKARPSIHQQRLIKSYQSLSNSSTAIDQSSRYTSRYTGLHSSRLTLSSRQFIYLLRTSTLFLYRYIKATLLSLYNPVKPSTRYYVNSSLCVKPCSSLRVQLLTYSSQLRRSLAAICLLFSKYSTPTSNDILLCFSSAPEASIFPQQGLLGHPSTQLLFLRLLFPNKSIFIKYHPRLFNLSVTEFNWKGYQPRILQRTFPSVFISDPRLSVEEISPSPTIISGVGSSSSIASCRGLTAYHLIYSHFSYIVPSLESLFIEKKNFSPSSLLHDRTVILSSATLYNYLRNRTSCESTTHSGSDYHFLLGNPEYLDQVLSQFLKAHDHSSSSPS